MMVEDWDEAEFERRLTETLSQLVHTAHTKGGETTTELVSTNDDPARTPGHPLGIGLPGVRPHRPAQGLRRPTRAH